MFFSRFPKRDSDPEQKLLINNNDPESGNLSQEEQIGSLLSEFDAIGSSLLAHVNKSVTHQLATLIPGASVNIAIYVGLSLAFPEFQFASMIASNAGSLTHALTAQATGVDDSRGTGPRIGNAVKITLMGGALCDGARGIGNLFSNDIAKLIASAVVPVLAQSALANGMTKNQHLIHLNQKAQSLVTKLDSLKVEFGEETFNKIVEQRLGNAGTANLYQTMKKMQ